MKQSLKHKIINNNIKDIHIEIESELIKSDSIFVFIHPLSFRFKKRRLLPDNITDNIATFNFELNFVGKNFIRIYENQKLVKEYIYEKNDADEFC